uniref:Uncharacterized protein n=1 Tax=Picea glauca TaxID=3330 RepID=A0A101LW73_PICGL|nr:hypothetical protein ABT39_MTgene1557 [Picea glauca]
MLLTYEHIDLVQRIDKKMNLLLMLLAVSERPRGEVGDRSLAPIPQTHPPMLPSDDERKKVTTIT